ncbi:M4 family metallopeptidase [Myxococcaceae bacterium GXIMD 01537]
MAHKTLSTLTAAGLALSLSACGNGSPTPSTEETGPKVEAADIQQAADALSSVEVVNVSSEGIPTFVRGSLGKSDQALQGFALGAAHSNIQRALPGVARLFRLDAADLAVKRVSQDARGNTYVRYGQKLNNLEVVGAELLVHVNKGGEIFAANGSARGGSKLAATPKLAAAQALTKAREDAARSGSTVRGEPRLVYVRSSLDQGLYLAYEVRVSGGTRDGAPVEDLIYVDANGGSLVDRHPLVHTALNRAVYSANNGTSLPGTLKRSEGGAAANDTHVDTNYAKLAETYNCYSTNFGRDSYNNAGALLKSTVHYSSNYVNAYWNGTQMVYGDGDGVNSTQLGLDSDVTTHELTHAVTENESNLTYSGQSGGLNEAMSDIFAAFCESWTSGTWSTSNDVFMVGEDIWTPATSGDALRYMYDPAKDGASLDYYPNYTSSTDVHYSSGIANLAFTLLAKGGTHPRGKTTVAVTGLGVEKAGHIFYEANANCLTASSTFADAKTCTESKATTLYGATDAASVTQAWEAVGVGTTAPTTCTPVALTNGVAATGISLATGAQKCYSLASPAGASNLKFALSGGTGDGDLYVKFGTAPTTSSYDCRPYLSGNAETCTFATPSTGTYYVMINAYSTVSGAQLLGSYTTGSTGGTALSNGVETAQYSGAASSMTCYTLSVPSGKTSLVFNQTGKTGTTGDADLYVKFGAQPTTTTYDCRPYASGSTESCSFTSPSAGTWYACSRGYSAYTAVTMKGTY